METKSAMIRARTMPAVKRRAEKVFLGLGITPTEAINMFYHQVALRQGIPFDVRMPTKETQQAMEDVLNNRNLKEYKDVDELLKEFGV